jgi:hypothetical protein
MKPYLITIHRAGHPALRYHGIFRHAVDAILHGLDTTADPLARVSARVIGGAP